MHVYMCMKVKDNNVRIRVLNWQRFVLPQRDSNSQLNCNIWNKR